MFSNHGRSLLSLLQELTEDQVTYNGGGGGMEATPPPHKDFLNFFLEDKTSAPDVFISCLFIPRAHFETGLVMASCYGFEIQRHK